MVSDVIREYVKSNGIKQTFLAKQCGWSKQKLGATLNGQRKLSADEMMLICQALNVPYDFFCSKT